MFRKTNEHLRERFVQGFTIARLGLAGWAGYNVINGESMLVPLGLFVVADYFDGVAARHLGVENTRRRVIDGAVDYGSILLVGAAAAISYPESRPYLGVLLARQMVVGFANLKSKQETGFYVQGRGLHKLDVMSIAAFGLVGTSGRVEAAETVGFIAASINAVTSVDYIINAHKPHGVIKDGVRRINFDFLKK